MAVAFANIFMAEKETKMINQSNTKPIKWKRYIDDIFSLPDSYRQEIDLFIKLANNFHAIIKFTAEISEMEITFLDTIITKGERLSETNRCLTSEHITSRLKPFSTQILPRATHQALKNVLSKVKPLDFLEQTLLKQSLMAVSQIWNHASPRAAILTKSYNVIRSQLHRKTVGTPTKSKSTQTNLAICHNIPPNGAQP